MNTTRSTKIFCILSPATFLLPFANSWGGFPVSYFWAAAVYFTFALLVQIALLRLSEKKIIRETYRLVLPLTFLLANLLFFTFFASNWGKVEIFFYALIFCFIFLMSALTAGGLKFSIIFLFLLLGLSLAGNVQIRLSQQEIDTHESRTSTAASHPQRSVYIIGIDSLVSRQARLQLFGQEQSEAYSWLDQNGFDLYDRVSPGDQTLTTFGSLLAGTPNVHPRTVRRLFNGSQESHLYAFLTDSGYKRQFFFENDYFGVDEGYIEDFKPIDHSWNFCKFMDDRWGFYFCRTLNRFLEPTKNTPIDIEDRVQFYTDNVRIQSNSSWFSISHIWYPGHTIGDYDGSNKRQREEFINYYTGADKNLVVIFSRVLNFIRQKDPMAVVVFMGDHGAHLLRSSEQFELPGYSSGDMESLKSLDNRCVLWAISPKGFCSEQVQNLKDSSLLLLHIARCASEKR